MSVRNIYYNLCISDGVIEECGFGGAGTAVLENGKRKTIFPGLANGGARVGWIVKGKMGFINGSINGLGGSPGIGGSKCSTQ